MFIEFHSDSNVNATDETVAPFRDQINNSLSKYSHQVSSVQVHFSDENGKQGGQDDKRCMIEVRLDGMNPIAVTGRSSSLAQALKLAIDKMKTSLDTRRDRLKTY
jgi:ribosome-associated translation inhibitor RaiA